MNTMVLARPFVHLFKSYNNNYIFDVNTNTVIKISEACYNHLDKLINALPSEEYSYIDENVQKELVQLSSNGYLKEKRLKNISAQYIDSLDYMLNNRLGMLTLQVTHQCNFRCSYCTYTYGGDSLHRSHSADRMTWEIAKTAIDFYANRTRDKKGINIGFYGGEPLLEYDLIKKCIEYANKLFRGKNLTYNLTTNGSLLDAEKLIYLVDNNVTILISLDGPKEIHNKNRKLASNGGGSFDVVYSNLMALMKDYPEYYNKLMYNSVVDTALDCSSIQNFFNCDNFDMKMVRTSFVTPVYGNDQVYNDDFYLYNEYETFKGFLALTGIIDIEDLTMFGKVVVGDIMKYQKNEMDSFLELPDEATHGGPCKPGITRLFIDIKGDILPCEKVNEFVDEMRIGNIYDGYDIEKVLNLVNIGNVTSKNCKECWCIAHCTTCVHTANDGRNISQDQILSKCNGVRYNVEYKLRIIAAIKEGKEIVRDIL